MNNFENGARIDTRPEEKKLKDFRIEELVSAPEPVPWIEKPQEQWRKFPDQYQNGSGSCVAQTIKKLGGINLSLKNKEYVELSATDIYQSRSNRPGSGMIGVESFDLWRSKGLTLEALVPSRGMSDEEIDSYKIEPYKQEVGKVFAIKNHVGLPVGDIETVASTIQKTKKGVMTWFYFTNKEWSQFVPEVIDETLTVSSSKALRHSVAAVDYTIYKGEKALIIEDSSPFGGLYRRVITESMFAKRNWFARYGTSFEFEAGTTTKPSHQFYNDLKFSTVFNTNPEVVILQDCLKWEGLFPSDRDSTGYYGAITAKAVYDFQKKYQVASNEELDALQGRSVGPKTRAMLNQVFL